MDSFINIFIEEKRERRNETQSKNTCYDIWSINDDEEESKCMVMLLEKGRCVRGRSKRLFSHSLV